MINIDTLMIAQGREIAEMFGTPMAPIVKHSPASHPFVGRYVICRCYSAGVHAGVLESLDGDLAILRDSRRLWQWQAVAGVALSGLAQHGLKAGKIDAVNPEIALTGVIEVIPCSDASRRSIENA